ncbi:MAG: hypothetical protein K9G42_10330 [Pedobacter sp.]|nr:hypothetical protein [Pedobacter sp.]
MLNLSAHGCATATLAPGKDPDFRLASAQNLRDQKGAITGASAPKLLDIGLKPNLFVPIMLQNIGLKPTRMNSFRTGLKTYKLINPS